jgi:hypothetical protein
MKFFLSLLLVAVMTDVNAQTIKNSQIILGKTDSVNSKLLVIQ